MLHNQGRICSQLLGSDTEMALNSFSVCVLKDFGALVAAAQPWEAGWIWGTVSAELILVSVFWRRARSVCLSVLEGGGCCYAPLCSVVLGQSNASSAHTSLNISL